MKRRRNPSLDYSSDDSCDERRRNLDWFMVAACERSDAPWDSDAAEVANLLREANEKFGWEIPINMDEITRKLKKTDNRVKEKSKLYQKQVKNRRKKDKKKRKKMSWIRHSTASPPSTITTEEHQHSHIQENPNRGSREAPVLVITRTLCPTDMGDQQQRLSFPSKQVKSETFLTEKEISEINKGIWVAARLRVPCEEEEEKDRKYNVNLRSSQAGPNGKCYAIGKPWNQIKTENGFEVGTTLNVLAYRGKKGQLKLILDRVN